MFQHSAISQSALSHNPMHQLAMQHAMYLYNNDAVYSFIPKNACSTLRLSIAKANGCISGIGQGYWIHQNNQTFMPSLAEAARAKYKFIILRCPFRRLASVFLDKFVAKEPPAWSYRDSVRQTVELDDLTFEQFVESLQKPHVFNLDIHWRLQTAFLLYEEYSDYFSLENFSDAIKVLEEKIGLKVIDARAMTGHGINDYELLNDSDYSKTTAFDIALLKRQGKCPDPANLYTPNLIELVKELYSQDFELYKQRCNGSDLLFSID